jgi:hypothetical protein
MYVITFNDEVLLGPVAWNALYFNSVIEQDTDLQVGLKQSDKNNVPISFSNGIKIRHAVENKPTINSKIQTYEGPFWTFNDNTGTHSYNPVDKPIEIVKGELKQQAASERYNKEISGISITLQNKEVFLSTKREDRNNFIQQLAIMSDNDNVNWKFNNTWMILSKDEVKICTNEISNYVKSVFEWEASINNLIDSATSLVELDSIEIVKKIESAKVQ